MNQQARPALRPALRAAVAALQRADTGAAAAALEAAFEADPDNADGWHLLGILEHQRGDHSAAALAIRHAVDSLPGGHALRPGMLNNLGNVQLESGSLPDAEEAYRESLAEQPDQAPAWTNLATLLRRLGRLAEATHAARQAVRAAPGSAEAHYALARALVESGDIPAGLRAHSQAVTLAPLASVPRDQMLRALVLLGRREQAAALYHEWLAADPGNPVALHQLAACEPGAPPARASDAYVQAVFDSVASRFDQKLAGLDYSAPALVAQAVLQQVGAPAAALDIADLGCGTGLCGPLLKPWARHLVGCDLSAGMLHQAQLRGCYDALHQAELVQFLQARYGEFDLLACADTLCYFGDLQAFAQATANALRAGGTACFTVEAAPDDATPGFRLQPSGRYVHTRAYLAAVLDGAGLQVLRLDTGTLRQEAGAPVPGWVVSAQAPRG